ncbi:MAG: class I SAM-dependent methyltransferase [Alphaproteobacteria bacterium]|nr:class I SAM-dependent methyltransferase [Alphaproteobacteria bacterium]
MKPFIDFYRANQISPVAQDISDLEKHFDRRAALYRHLGLVPSLLRGKAVIEFGPGSGYNSIYTSSLGPRRYLLVEGNPTGLEATRALLDERGSPETEHLITESLIEDFASPERFDVVLCEGVIPMQHEPQAFLRHVAEFAAPGGVVVTTCMDSVSQFAEIMRRLVGALAVAPEQSTEEKLERLRPMFEPHLATLAGRSRLVDDWILDVVIQPWVGSMLSIADAIEALDSAFDVYGSSPQFFTDWRWYKDIHGEARRFNQNAIAAFYRNLHNLIDYRHTWAPRAPEANHELLALCDSIFELERRFESAPKNGAISDIAAELRGLRALTAEFSPATADAIGDLVAALETLGSYGGSSGDLPSLGGFAPLVGRGQQDRSVIRR